MYTFFHITALDTEELREGDLDRSKLRKLDPEAVAGGQLFQGPKVKESISEQRKQVCFQQAHNQCFVSVVFDGVPGPLRLAWHTYKCP